mmetsp:Transcript_14843/g.43332  ORF Transcript_14843/g.43332 Transcript_14843/m.43332 type:complete len:307 (+) Transcript_14843:697-1617(+)
MFRVKLVVCGNRRQAGRAQAAALRVQDEVAARHALLPGAQARELDAAQHHHRAQEAHEPLRRQLREALPVHVRERQVPDRVALGRERGCGEDATEVRRDLVVERQHRQRTVLGARLVQRRGDLGHEGVDAPLLAANQETAEPVLCPLEVAVIAADHAQERKVTEEALVQEALALAPGELLGEGTAQAFDEFELLGRGRPVVLLKRNAPLPEAIQCHEVPASIEELPQLILAAQQLAEFRIPQRVAAVELQPLQDPARHEAACDPIESGHGPGRVHHHEAGKNVRCHSFVELGTVPIVCAIKARATH